MVRRYRSYVRKMGQQGPEVIAANNHARIVLRWGKAVFRWGKAVFRWEKARQRKGDKESMIWERVWESERRTDGQTDKRTEGKVARWPER